MRSLIGLKHLRAKGRKFKMMPNKVIKPFAALTRIFDHAACLAAPSLPSRSNAAYHSR
jgi:hypothetical protein